MTHNAGYRFTMLTRNLSLDHDANIRHFVNTTNIYAIFFLLICINFDSII